MLPKQKYAVYNNQNVTRVLIQAQNQKHLVDNIVNMKCNIDQSPPRKFSHIKKLGNKGEKVRQRNIDIENQKLLSSIMNIMKRRNQSVQQARRAPSNIIGGGSSVMSRAGIVDGIYNSSMKGGDSMLMNSTVGRNNSIGSQGDKFRTQRASLQQAENQSSIDKIEGPKIDQNTDGEGYGSQDNYYTPDDQILASGPSIMNSKRASQNQTVQMNYESLQSQTIQMRGSLNVGYRKHEMQRINKGNRKILDQLKQVRPSVGTINEWRKHEYKQKFLSRHIKGMHLESASKGRNNFDRNSTAPQSFTNTGMPVSQNSQRPPKGSKFILPKLQDNIKRMSGTAGNFNKRQASVDMQLEYEQRRQRDRGGSQTPNTVLGNRNQQDNAFMQKRKLSLDGYSYGTGNQLSNKKNTVANITDGLYLYHQNSSDQKDSRLQSRGSTSNKKVYRSPLVQMSHYPQHIMKRIMKEQQENGVAPVHQWSMRSSFKPIIGSQELGSQDSVPSYNPLIQAQDKSHQQDSDKVWMQAHQQQNIIQQNTNEIKIVNTVDQVDRIQEDASNEQDTNTYTDHQSQLKNQTPTVPFKQNIAELGQSPQYPMTVGAKPSSKITEDIRTNGNTSQQTLVQKADQIVKETKPALANTQPRNDARAAKLTSQGESDKKSVESQNNVQKASSYITTPVKDQSSQNKPNLTADKNQKK